MDKTFSDKLTDAVDYAVEAGLTKAEIIAELRYAIENVDADPEIPE